MATVTYEYETSSSLNEINDLGARGWRVIHVDYTNNTTWYTLERENRQSGPLSNIPITLDEMRKQIDQQQQVINRWEQRFAALNDLVETMREQQVGNQLGLSEATARLQCASISPDHPLVVPADWIDQFYTEPLTSEDIENTLELISHPAANDDQLPDDPMEWFKIEGEQFATGHA